MSTEAMPSIQPYGSLLDGPSGNVSGHLAIHAASVATHSGRKYASCFRRCGRSGHYLSSRWSGLQTHFWSARTSASVCVLCWRCPYKEDSCTSIAKLSADTPALRVHQSPYRTPIADGDNETDRILFSFFRILKRLTHQ
jgi:hypothetical protein